MDQTQTFDHQDHQSVVWNRLITHDFDYAPVTRQGAVVGYLARADLDKSSRATIAHVAQPLDIDVLATADAPLQEAIHWFVDSQFRLLLEGKEISGLVTPSDLNKQAGRTYFYLLLAELELGLAELIRRRYRNQNDVVRWIQPAHQSSVPKKYASARLANSEADLVSHMYFKDLLLIARSSTSIRRAISDVTPTDWERWAKELNDLRKETAHPVKPLYGPHRSIEKLIELEGVLRSLTRMIAHYSPPASRVQWKR